MKATPTPEQAKQLVKDGNKVWYTYKDSRGGPVIWYRVNPEFHNFDHSSIFIYGIGPEKQKDSYEAWHGEIRYTEEDWKATLRALRENRNADKKHDVSKRSHVTPTRRSATNGGFVESAVIGAVTDSAIIGTILGGSIEGAIIGDFLNGGDLMD